MRERLRPAAAPGASAHAVTWLSFAEQSQAQQATDAAAANRENETRKARCRHARRELEILKLERPVYHLDQEGNKVFLEDDKRAAELKRVRGEVKSNCR